VSRSRRKFKIELNSNQFANYKKRFGNRKGISNFYLAVGRNPAGNRAQPDQPLLFPSPSFLQGPVASMVRSPAGSPFRACSPVAGSLLFSSHSPLCSPVTDPSASRYRVRHPGEKPDTEFIPARCSSTRVHPLSKSVAIRRVCFKLEIELSSSPRPLRVDGFPPINRSFTRRRCIQTLAAIAARACTVAPPNQGLRSQSAA
jgi:hypothetical protein